MAGFNEFCLGCVVVLLVGLLIFMYMRNSQPDNIAKKGEEHSKCSKKSKDSKDSKVEHMEEPRRIDNSANNMAPTELAPEADTLMQKTSDLIFAGPESDKLDNSDLIQEYVQKGDTIFQPNTAQGVTTTSSAYHSNFSLAQPGMYLEYGTPLNSRAYNADEALARKQQHRSSMNKRAIDGAVRATKNMFQKYFTDELRENEEREWWSAEAQDMETDFRPYY